MRRRITLSLSVLIVIGLFLALSITYPQGNARAQGTSTSWGFNKPSDYQCDTSLVDISGGTARTSTLPLENGWWTKTYDNGHRDVANGVSCDADGNSVVAGGYFSNGTDGNIWVRKYRGTDGATLWTKTYDSGNYDEAYAVSCDADGNPVVAGSTYNGIDYNVWVRKYRGSDGATLWTKTYGGGDNDEAYGVSCDADGNPVVAGYISNVSDEDIWVRKYRGSDGATLWTKTYDGGPNDEAHGVSCDADGNPVVTGYTKNGIEYDIWVRKYRGSDGATLWTKTYNGGHNDFAYGVSCDAEGNPVAAGSTYNGTNYDIWVRKYRGSDGATLWTKTYSGGHDDKAFGVSCDAEGNPVAAGFTNNGTDGDIWVRKYRGSDGATLWTETYDGGHGDYANGVSCDPYGNPVVAGYTNNGTNDDVWVRKYPPGLYASTKWYLAEGTTSWGFSTYITIENPNASTVTANVTYMPTGKANKTEVVSLPPSSQTTLTNDHLVSVMAGASDFSTKVVCKEGKTIAVDRTMSWTGEGAASPEAHSSVGVTSPAKTWYLPEGSSKWGFECWLLIQNPNSQTAHCTVTYMIEGQGPKTVSHTVPKASRASFNMADDIGSSDASIKVESNIPVIPERAMYKNSRREGHDSIGTTTPASDYFLAEGTTDYGFTTYVLVQNPNPSPVDVTITYMTPGGPKPQGAFSMDPNSRKTIRVNDIAEVSKTDFSTKVHGSKAIIAERAMYWNNGTGEACHDSIGMASSHTTFYLPDGQSSEGRETYTLIQNPNTAGVQVEISYLTPNGEGNVVKTETIAASSRRTFNMLEHSGIQGRAAVMVKSKTAGKKIMVERAMYWNSRGAGTDTIGGASD